VVEEGEKLGCMSGQCPVMDGGYSDNGPVTPSLAYSSKLSSPLRPRQLQISGPGNSFALVKYLMGEGPLSLYTLAGVNMCPFVQSSICTMLTTVRTMLIGSMGQETYLEYTSLGSTYGVYKPEAQVMYPYCGDPLAFDLFMGMCKTDGLCYEFINVIPSVYADIHFTVDPFVLEMSLVFLSNTPISERFVNKYIPQTMRRTQFYANMEMWFPDFKAVSPKRGGVAFSRSAGHSLLDYMTYLVERLSEHIVISRLLATEVYHGMNPHCGYLVYEKIHGYNYATETDLKFSDRVYNS
jgi:hypothetical protein